MQNPKWPSDYITLDFHEILIFVYYLIIMFNMSLILFQNAF